MLCDAVLEEFNDAVETSIDLLASVVLFLGISSDSYAPGNLVPPFNGNLDVGIDLKLDSPAFFALGDKDVCPDRDIPLLCLSSSDKKSDCSRIYSKLLSLSAVLAARRVVIQMH